MCPDLSGTWTDNLCTTAAINELLIDCVVVIETPVEIRYVIPTTEASAHSRFYDLRKDYFYSQWALQQEDVCAMCLPV